jgi:hypothetical protein
MLEVVLSNGDRAERETEDGILYAARYIIAEAATTYGAARMLRSDVIIARDNVYDGRLTQLAREGRL